MSFEPEVRIPDLLPPTHPRCPGCNRRHPIYDIDDWAQSYSLAAHRAWLAAHRMRMQSLRTLIRERNQLIRGHRPYPHHF